MIAKCFKSLFIAAFSLFILLFTNVTIAQTEHENGVTQTENGPTVEKEEKIDAAKVIMEHIMDSHEFHFAEIGGHPVAIPLPVILYSPQRSFTSFMSSNFEHGHTAYQGYKAEGKNIVAVDANGNVDESVKVYDFSLTRNVVQMFLAIILLMIIMLNVAKKYKKNGNIAPSGFQNAIEPVITFVRDEVGKPNLGQKYEKYMPYLLTVFFFILINNLFGLIPGSANVTGNISFTFVLAIVSLIVILFSTNFHFWAHIFWPPGVPIFVKIILIPIEVAGVFIIKPGALMIRLFANMVAGHIVIICFISLIFIFGAMSKVAGVGFSPVSLAFTVFIYFIELLVAFIQAFIFTNLTAVFIGQAFETGHVDHGDLPHDPHPTHDHKEKEFAL